MTYHRWSQDEIDHLDQMAGELPFAVLVKSMQSKARKHGWPKRSAKAITMRLVRTSQPRKAKVGEWTTPNGAAEILGCPGCRVDSWLRQQRVREVLALRRIGMVRYISRESWRQLAKQIPQILGGFSADSLFLLLEDRKLAEAVAARYPNAVGDYRVRCIETGQIWSSCRTAAAEYHVSQATITRGIRRGVMVPVIGLTFEALRGARSVVLH